MATCKDFLENLSVSIDGVLSPSEQSELNNHLETCSTCREKLAFEKYTLSLLHNKLPVVTAPASLRENILNNISRQQSAKSWWKNLLNINILRPIPLVTTLATICIVVITTIKVMTPLPADAAKWWVCNAAYYCHENNEKGLFKMDVVTSDPREMVVQVNKAHKRDFNLVLPHFNPDEFQLVSAHFCELGSKPSIYLAMKKNGHLVSLEITDTNDIKLPRAQKYNAKGGKYYRGTYYYTHVLMWEKNNLLYTVTSDLPEEELNTIITPDSIALVNTGDLTRSNA